jgi:hypothetical protein
MDYEIMRLECLRLATGQGLKGETAVEAARSMMQFVREGSLLDKAHGQSSDRMETPTVTVHRRPPFLDDYNPE